MNKFLVKVVLSFFVFLGSIYAMEKQDTAVQNIDIAALSIGSDEDSSHAESSNSGTNEAALAKPYTITYFSPGIISILKQFIQQEQQMILGAQFRFTHYGVAKALADFKTSKKNDKIYPECVHICIDKDFQKDFCHALALLIENKIPVRCNGAKKRFKAGLAEYEIMHHKFFIFEQNNTAQGIKQLLWTGSFNVTGNANTNSWENVIITDDKMAIVKFKKEFIELRNHSRPITKEECEKGKQSSSQHAKNINEIP